MPAYSLRNSFVVRKAKVSPRLTLGIVKLGTYLSVALFLKSAAQVKI